MIVQCLNAIHESMMACLLCYRKSLTNEGLEFGPYNPCVANKMFKGKQMTICFHVDDCKPSHKSTSIVTQTIKWLKHEHESIVEDGSGCVTMSHGKVYKCLETTLDCSTPRIVKTSMFNCNDKMLEAFDKADPAAAKAARTKSSSTPQNLFVVDKDRVQLSTVRSKGFHNSAAKRPCVMKQGTPNISIPIALPMMRVRKPDRDD